ncbi:hypothetical protein [Flavobacterium sp. ZE23DGlu08]|uniref:hypothetical protein n=1 Tax=Flavobacterium sp. ZE23DGlu08 TaxID=3059026 RepID=UPI00265FCEAF|nr:hypothetical protein [Flavobacterium sp. ZE23DGlu08]WKL44344.1 hypothetical protein Q1W72_01660 [Flavobacterium sp. ZE23DGlu08]
MKILLATDGSKYSKTAINEIANRPFPPKTEVCILAAYEITSILNTLEPMGGKTSQIDHPIPVQIDHQFRSKLTTTFQFKLTT